MMSSSTITHSSVHLKKERKYDPARFVERKELETIRQRVKDARHKPVLEPIINFWGVRGIGKTWLLQNINEEYKYKGEKTFSLFYDFQENGTPSLKKFICDLSDKILEQFPEADPKFKEEDRKQLMSVQETGDISVFVRVLKKLSEGFVPVLLLDNADQVPPEVWEEIEYKLIEPLVITNKVIVVLSGRKQIPHWKRFEVRRRVTETEKTALALFTEEQIKTQLQDREGFKEWLLPLLFSFTAGSPYLVNEITDWFLSWEQDTIEEEHVEEWLERHTADLVSILKEAEQILLEKTPEDLQKELRLLSPLRFYRIEAVRYMYKKYGASTSEELPDIHFLNVLRNLEFNSDVVWWDRERRAYTTSQVVRQVMNQIQFWDNKEAYLKLHQTACAMYWDWVEEYPRVSEDFLLEYWFHLASANAVKQDQNLLNEKLKKTLEFAKEHLSIERLDILQQLLKKDKELKSLLSGETLNDLENTLNEWLPKSIHTH